MSEKQNKSVQLLYPLRRLRIVTTQNFANDPMRLLNYYITFSQKVNTKFENNRTIGSFISLSTQKRLRTFCPKPFRLYFSFPPLFFFRRGFRLFRTGGTDPDYLSRTLVDAGITARTFFVIYFRKIIYHRYGVFGTVLRAQSATYATDLAHAHYFFSAAMRRACDINGRGRGYAFDKMLRARAHTHAARNTYVRIDIRDAVVYRYRMLGTRFQTSAVTETTVVAHLRALKELRLINAGANTRIFIKVFRVRSPAAHNAGDSRFLAAEFESENTGYILLVLGRSHVAIGQTALAFAELFGKARATRTAATAAIRAGKFFEYPLELFVRIYFADFAYYEYEYGEYERDRAEYSDDYSYGGKSICGNFAYHNLNLPR